jgi:hypothetical protein
MRRDIHPPFARKPRVHLPPHLWAGVSLFFFKPKPAQSGGKQGAVGEDRYGDHRVTGSKII